MALTTGDQIEIDVHDDAAAMTRLFSLPVSARMDALAAMRGFSAFDDVPMKTLRQIHEEGDGFRVGVDDPRYPDALVVTEAEPLLAYIHSYATATGADQESALRERIQSELDAHAGAFKITKDCGMIVGVKT